MSKFYFAEVPQNNIIIDALKKVFTDLGYTYTENVFEAISNGYCISMSPGSKRVMYCSDGSSQDHTKISLKELIKMFSGVVTVDLNNEYTATIDKDGIKVGCQTFSFESFDKLAEAVAKIRGDNDN